MSYSVFKTEWNGFFEKRNHFLLYIKLNFFKDLPRKKLKAVENYGKGSNPAQDHSKGVATLNEQSAENGRSEHLL